MLTGHVDYHDLGGDYFLKRDPERERRRAIAALNKLGYTGTLNPIEPTQPPHDPFQRTRCLTRLADTTRRPPSRPGAMPYTQNPTWLWSYSS